MAGRRKSPIESNLGQDLAKNKVGVQHPLAWPCLPHLGRVPRELYRAALRKGDTRGQQIAGQHRSSLQLTSSEASALAGRREAGGRRNPLVLPSPHLLVCSLLWPEAWLWPPDSGSPCPCSWRGGLRMKKETHLGENPCHTLQLGWSASSQNS